MQEQVQVVTNALVDQTLVDQPLPGQELQLSQEEVTQGVILTQTYSQADMVLIGQLVSLVRSNFLTMQAAAVEICISLATLRNLVGEDGTWADFCQSNLPYFAPSKVRACVSNGRKLLDFKTRNPAADLTRLGQLKMAALNCLMSNSDDTVVTAVMSLTDAGVQVTAKQVEELQQRNYELTLLNTQLGHENQEILHKHNNELMTAKLSSTEAELKLSRSSKLLHDLERENSQLGDRVRELTQQKEELERKLTQGDGPGDETAYKRELKKVEKIRQEVQDLEDRREVVGTAPCSEGENPECLSFSCGIFASEISIEI